MDLETLLVQHRTIRVIGFDDAPFDRYSGQPVNVAGVVCGGTRFEGMLWGQIQVDGWDATDTLCQMLGRSKFLPQIHLVLLDGISLGGFNLIDLPLMAERLRRPCCAVMRRHPDLHAVVQAMKRLPDADVRAAIMQRAGPIYEHRPFYFQVAGVNPAIAGNALARLTDCGNVPEALRLAHLITSAVVKGESGRQA